MEVGMVPPLAKAVILVKAMETAIVNISAVQRIPNKMTIIRKD
jgi:hypothetical protein